MIQPKYLDFCERNIDRALRINAEIHGFTIERNVHRLGVTSINMAWSIEEICAYELQLSSEAGRFKLKGGGSCDYMPHPKWRN